jgi:hypothetical protein
MCDANTIWHPRMLEYPRLHRAVNPNPGRLEFGVFIKRMQRFIAAHAALLDAAKGHGDVVFN